MKKHSHIHKNYFKNKFATLFHAFLTNFGTKEKVDEINKKNLKKVKKGKQDLTILLHGVSANYHRSMYSTIRLLHRYGVDVVSVGYDYQQSIEDSSKNVKEQIEDLMKKSDVKMINIIGICLGGLVARYYAEKLNGKRNINRLVTVYSPLKPIPKIELGVIINRLVGGRPRIYNHALKEIQDIHTVKNHLYIYSEHDKIIRPRYSTHEKANHICTGSGHLFISYNPRALEVAAKYIKGEKILEERL